MLTSRQIFRYAVPARTVTKKHCLRETKTYLNSMHASESTLDSGTSGTASHSSRHDMLAIISSRYQYGSFLFFVSEVMSNYLTIDGLKKFSLLPEAPPPPSVRPVAFATSATWLIRHWIVRSGWLCAVEGGKLTRYHLVKDKKTWNDANEYCKQNQMSLVVIANQQEQIQLQAFLKRQWLCHTYYPRESFREGLWNHRRAFVCLSVCLSVRSFVTTITK